MLLTVGYSNVIIRYLSEPRSHQHSQYCLCNNRPCVTLGEGQVELQFVIWVQLKKFWKFLLYEIRLIFSSALFDKGLRPITPLTTVTVVFSRTLKHWNPNTTSV